MRTIKRLCDILLALAALATLAPVMLLVGAAIRRRMGTPVLFRQIRPGQDGKPFTLLKFRTMREARDADGPGLSDGERLTDLGRTLRRFSLDELPQLWNVLRGEMSLVGPRPLLMEYLPLYDDRQRRRHDVRPGITGWAQVNGRNALTWRRRFELDVWYVEHWSLTLDAKILAMTVANVLRGTGVSAQGHATMPPFPGNQPPAEPAAEPDRPTPPHRDADALAPPGENRSSG